MKILIILMVSLSFATPATAKMIEEADLYFRPNTERLMKGDIQYSFHLLGAKKLLKQFPEVAELDSLSALKEKKAEFLVTKTVYVVKKPVGFFDHEHMQNEKYVSHIMGEQKVSQLGNNTFMVTVPGKAAYHYKMKTYVDSDDISTLPNSRTLQAVTAVRKLDVISQSASSIVFKEFTSFSKYSVAGVAVQSYISLKEGQTLVISYQLTAIKRYYAIEKLLKPNFLKETAAVKSLIQSYLD